MLAYKNELDTLIPINSLQKKPDIKITTTTVNAVQSEELLNRTEEKSKISVLKHFSNNSFDEFTSNNIFSVIKINVLNVGKYHVSTRLSMSLIAKNIVEIGKQKVY